MHRIMFVLFTLVSLLWMSAAAMAQQASMMSDCDKWIATINAEAGARVDEASYTAKQKIDDIAKMCKEGKMAEDVHGCDGPARDQAVTGARTAVVARPGWATTARTAAIYRHASASVARSYRSPRVWGPQPPAGPAARTAAPRRPAARTTS